MKFLELVAERLVRDVVQCAQSRSSAENRTQEPRAERDCGAPLVGARARGERDAHSRALDSRQRVEAGLAHRRPLPAPAPRSSTARASGRADAGDAARHRLPVRLLVAREPVALVQLLLEVAA